MRVWDLRRIRAELVKLRLDWDAPAYKTLGNKHQEASLEIRVDLGQLAPPPKAKGQSKKDKTW